ncbi:hypothetical protein VTN77DRAFT_7675 [Rasamsonia byssochlamydoides]|uniref:uncharacterized protein n=1 Tax=Rasamsonia byssochlamydoides TaxID=89139 RepID=UPI003742ACC5
MLGQLILQPVLRTPVRSKSDDRQVSIAEEQVNTDQFVRRHIYRESSLNNTIFIGTLYFVDAEYTILSHMQAVNLPTDGDFSRLPQIMTRLMTTMNPIAAVNGVNQTSGHDLRGNPWMPTQLPQFLPSPEFLAALRGNFGLFQLP